MRRLDLIIALLVVGAAAILALERLRAAPEDAASLPDVVPSRKKDREQRRATRIAAEKCGGALAGRFASVRVNP